MGFADGARESAQDWRELLLDLKSRGLTTAPQLAIADGGFGFSKALGEIWPMTQGQRCWVHKTANVLNKLPRARSRRQSAACRRSGWRRRGPRPWWRSTLSSKTTAEIRESRRLPGQRPGGVARLLRLSRRALETLENVETDRERCRHSARRHDPHERLPVE